MKKICPLPSGIIIKSSGDMDRGVSKSVGQSICNLSQVHTV